MKQIRYPIDVLNLTIHVTKHDLYHDIIYIVQTES